MLSPGLRIGKISSNPSDCADFCPFLRNTTLMVNGVILISFSESLCNSIVGQNSIPPAEMAAILTDKFLPFIHSPDLPFIPGL